LNSCALHEVTVQLTSWNLSVRRHEINIVYSSVSQVSGVDQWLRCRSSAGGLSLIYAWSMVDMWPFRG